MPMLQDALADLVGSAPVERLADPVERLKAAGVDALLNYGPWLAATLIAREIPDNRLALGLGLTGMFATLAVVLYQYASVARTGQTIGKRLVEIRVVRLDGTPPGWAHGVLLRNVVFGIGVYLAGFVFVGWLIGLADALLLFSPDHRTLHDRLAGTRVVVA
jgi:uncharacterized RDD family membrane protein YckC